MINAFNRIIYVAEDWRLFLDSSTKNFKAVLIHNGNFYASVPIPNFVVLKEEYQNLKLVLETLQYEKHNWQICSDFKIVTIILGQQGGFTKFSCF